MVIFSSSLLGGFFINSFKGYLSKTSAIGLIVVTVVLNWNYFKPQQFIFNLTDKEKLSGKLWEVQQKAAILDYLPIQAVEPLEPVPDRPIIVEGGANIKDFQNKSNSWKFKVEVKKDSKIEVPIFDFPNWQVFVNGVKMKHSNKNYLGRISFSLSPGYYIVTGKLENTRIRTISNIVSLVSILMIICMLLYGKIRKTNI